MSVWTAIHGSSAPLIVLSLAAPMGCQAPAQGRPSTALGYQLPPLPAPA